MAGFFPHSRFMKGQPPAGGDDTPEGVWILPGKRGEERISSILRGMEGIIQFGSPAENTVSITFDDLKTDEEKIVQVLDAGRVAIQGKQAPAILSLFYE